MYKQFVLIGWALAVNFVPLAVAGVNSSEFNQKYINPIFHFSFHYPPDLLIIDSENFGDFLKSNKLRPDTKANLKSSSWPKGSVYLLKEMTGDSGEFSFLINPTSEMKNKPADMNAYVEEQMAYGKSKGQPLDILPAVISDGRVRGVTLINKTYAVYNTVFSDGVRYFTFVYYATGLKNPRALQTYYDIVRSLSFE